MTSKASIPQAHQTKQVQASEENDNSEALVRQHESLGNNNRGGSANQDMPAIDIHEATRSSRSENSLTSLLAADDEEEEEEVADDWTDDLSQASHRPTANKSKLKKQQPDRKPSQAAVHHQRHTLTKLQEEISYAIEANNMHYFVDLGGVFYYDINFTGRSGFPLKIAATKGHENFMKLLLENSMIDINKQDEDGLNAFWIAARCGHGNVLKVLAEHGIDIYNCDNRGENALIMSARYSDRFRICELLVNSNYNLNLTNHNGDTATHIAAQKGNVSQLKVLLEAGANCDMLNKNNLSPMYLAILNNHTECVYVLLEAGAKAFFGDSDTEKDRSPVFLAIRTQQVEVLQAIFAYVEPQVQSLISDSKGQTPVMFAAKNGYHEALNALIELNSTSINQEDNQQRTILMHVLQAEPFDRRLANRLVDEWEADVDHIDIFGRSMLIKLVQEKKKDLVAFLLSKGALMHVLDEDQKDACDYAKDNGLALELPEFLNCSIKKKRDDMQKLTLKQGERSNQLEHSFKVAKFASAQRRASIASRHESHSDTLTANFGVNLSIHDFQMQRPRADSSLSYRSSNPAAANRSRRGSINRAKLSPTKSVLGADQRDALHSLDGLHAHSNSSSSKSHSKKTAGALPAQRPSQFKPFANVSPVLADSNQPPVSNPGILAELDPKLREEMKQAMDAMHQRSINAVKAMMDLAAEREAQRQAQLRSLLQQEVDVKEQLEKQKQSANRLQSIFQSQMADCMQSFKDQVQASMDRLASLQAEERAKLEEQKVAAMLEQAQLSSEAPAATTIESESEAAPEEVPQVNQEKAAAKSSEPCQEAALVNSNITGGDLLTNTVKEIARAENSRKAATRETHQVVVEKKAEIAEPPFKAQAMREMVALKLRQQAERYRREEALAECSPVAHQSLQEIYSSAIEAAQKEKEAELKIIREQKKQVVKQLPAKPQIQVLSLIDNEVEQTVSRTNLQAPQIPPLVHESVKLANEVIEEESSSQQSIMPINTRRQSEKSVNMIAEKVRQELCEIYDSVIEREDNSSLSTQQKAASKPSTTNASSTTGADNKVAVNDENVPQKQQAATRFIKKQNVTFKSTALKVVNANRVVQNVHVPVQVSENDLMPNILKTTTIKASSINAASAASHTAKDTSPHQQQKTRVQNKDTVTLKDAAQAQEEHRQAKQTESSTRVHQPMATSISDSKRRQPQVPKTLHQTVDKSVPEVMNQVPHIQSRPTVSNQSSDRLVKSKTLKSTTKAASPPMSASEKAMVPAPLQTSLQKKYSELVGSRKTAGPSKPSSTSMVLPPPSSNKNQEKALQILRGKRFGAQAGASSKQQATTTKVVMQSSPAKTYADALKLSKKKAQQLETELATLREYSSQSNLQSSHQKSKPTRSRSDASQTSNEFILHKQGQGSSRMFTLSDKKRTRQESSTNLLASKVQDFNSSADNFKVIVEESSSLSIDIGLPQQVYGSATQDDEDERDNASAATLQGNARIAKLPLKMQKSQSQLASQNTSMERVARQKPGIYDDAAQPAKDNSEQVASKLRLHRSKNSKQGETTSGTGAEGLIPPLPKQMSRYDSNVKQRQPAGGYTNKNAKLSALKNKNLSIKMHPQVQGLLNRYSQNDLMAYPYLSSISDLLDLQKKIKDASTRQVLQRKIQSHRENKLSNKKDGQPHVLGLQQIESVNRLLKESPYAVSYQRTSSRSGLHRAQNQLLSPSLHKSDFIVDVQRKEFPAIASINIQASQSNTSEATTNLQRNRMSRNSTQLFAQPPVQPQQTHHIIVPYNSTAQLEQSNLAAASNAQQTQLSIVVSQQPSTLATHADQQPLAIPQRQQYEN